jgi:hypothetical protein
MKIKFLTIIGLLALSSSLQATMVYLTGYVTEAFRAGEFDGTAEVGSSVQAWISFNPHTLTINHENTIVYLGSAYTEPVFVTSFTGDWINGFKIESEAPSTSIGFDGILDLSFDRHGGTFFAAGSDPNQELEGGGIANQHYRGVFDRAVVPDWGDSILLMMIGLSCLALRRLV